MKLIEQDAFVRSEWRRGAGYWDEPSEAQRLIMEAKAQEPFSDPMYDRRHYTYLIHPDDPQRGLYGTVSVNGRMDLLDIAREIHRIQMLLVSELAKQRKLRL